MIIANAAAGMGLFSQTTDRRDGMSHAMTDTQADHASDSYLAGLSELDRARAIVAVGWCGARWSNCHLHEGIPVRCLSMTAEATCAEMPVDPADWYTETVDKATGASKWGVDWRGTASLMVLAESKGWRLARLEGPYKPTSYVEQYGYDALLRRKGSTLNDLAAESGTRERPYCDTVHEAILLACAKAAQMEAP